MTEFVGGWECCAPNRHVFLRAQQFVWGNQVELRLTQGFGILKKSKFCFASGDYKESNFSSLCFLTSYNNSLSTSLFFRFRKLFIASYSCPSQHQESAEGS